MIEITEMLIVRYLMINGHLKAAPNTNSVIKRSLAFLFLKQHTHIPKTSMRYSTRMSLVFHDLQFIVLSARYLYCILQWFCQKRNNLLY